MPRKSKVFPCLYCRRSFPNRASLAHHVVLSRRCLSQAERATKLLLSQMRRRPASAVPPVTLADAPDSDDSDAESILPDAVSIQHDLMSTLAESDELTSRPGEALDPASGPTADLFVEEPEEVQVQDPGSTSHNPRIEDVPDEDNYCPRFVEDCDPRLRAGACFGTAKTSFELIRDDQVLRGAEVWGPFADESEWLLAKFLIKNVGKNQAEEFLKLPFARNANVAFRTSDKLYSTVDQLPKGMKWKCDEITVKGDLRNEHGDLMTDTLEVWHRDPLECIRELLGNPIFRQKLTYAPRRMYCDDQGTERYIDEMSSADWWWELQRIVPQGTTIAPVILSSDKTVLSRFRGDKSAWPIYLTIGNLAKEVRRSPSMHGTILLGYLPIGKFECYASATARKLAAYQVFHTAIRTMLTTLVEAIHAGGFMTVCADHMVRKILPILAAYVADFPEQCLIADCMQNRCPAGQVAPDERGKHAACLPRDQQEILILLARHRDKEITAEERQRFVQLGLHAVYDPFWKDIPFSNIFQCFTPDLLHQLHKGVFKDHLVKWCTVLVGEAELDARFKGTPTMRGLRHFKNGISKVTQWTGHEFKQMEKVFLGLVAGAVDARIVSAVRALIDFIYLASLQSQTTSTLAALQASLDLFHANKDAFIELNARKLPHFNIPKFHMMVHYVDSIRFFGSADGFNTEWSERLHIDYAKEAYRATNKKDYVSQMTRWLERQEAVDRYSVYIEWVASGEYGADAVGEDDEGNDGDPAGGEEEVQEVQEVLSTIVPSVDIHQASAALPFEPQAPVAPSSSHLRIPASRNPTLRNVSTPQIIRDHNAPMFSYALDSFMRARGSTALHYDFDKFNLFQSLVVTLPKIPQVSSNKCRDVIRVSPPVLKTSRKAAEPAHLDFALVRVNERNPDTDGTALAGLRIAQIRVLFELPSIYGLGDARPVAYIEWFTPFRKPDPLTGMYTVSRSSRSGHVHAEIVEVGLIVRSCHLMPKYSRVKDVRWTSENVSNHCKTFWVNSYIDYHAYCLFRLHQRRSIPIVSTTM